MGKVTPLAVAAVLPIASLWVARHQSIILRFGEPLSSRQAAWAAKLGVVHPEKVRLLAVQTIPPTNPMLRALGTKLGFVSDETIGMTLRYGIYIQARHWGERRLLLHELAHVAQYERLGSIRRFLFHYLRECIEPGYPLGELEVEARQAERSVG